MIDAENKSTDLYNQLLSTKENFQILHNEQKMLSDELTSKHREMQVLERTKLEQERELLQLRPLRDQLNKFDESNRSHIEQNVKTEYEKQKLTKLVTELQNDVDRLKSDNDDLTTQNFSLTEQNTLLIEQIKNFEKQSFEIHAKLQRGLEISSENQTQNEKISSLKDKESDLQRQLNTLNQHIVLKDSEITRAHGKIETLQAYSKTLEAEIKESRQKIAQLNEEIHSGQSSTIQNEHKKNQ